MFVCLYVPIQVANHSSMIDVIVLVQNTAFAMVGQKHPGWVGMPSACFVIHAFSPFYEGLSTAHTTTDNTLISQQIRDSLRLTALYQLDQTRQCVPTLAVSLHTTGFFQQRVLNGLGCVWFDRAQSKDRETSFQQ